MCKDISCSKTRFIIYYQDKYEQAMIVAKAIKDMALREKLWRLEDRMFMSEDEIQQDVDKLEETIDKLIKEVENG